MTANSQLLRRWLLGTVAVHFLVSLVHGFAHDRARVPLSPAATLFVLIVVLAAPLIGIGLMQFAERLGSWLTGVAMAGALVFGLVNHFVVPSPDHVAHVSAIWRPWFAGTAILLALTEALGLAFATRLALADDRPGTRSKLETGAPAN